jgi:hypothetical protein
MAKFVFRAVLSKPVYIPGDTIDACIVLTSLQEECTEIGWLTIQVHGHVIVDPKSVRFPALFLNKTISSTHVSERQSSFPDLKGYGGLLTCSP